MGLVLTDDRHYKAIADKIRECLPEEYAEATYTPGEMPSGIDDVSNTNFNTGYENGHIDGHREGEEAGKQAEYDRFWDMWQDNGNRTDYSYGFAYGTWHDAMFKPKYPLKPINADRMFTTMRGLTEIKGVDFSLATNIHWLFRSSEKLISIGVCDFSSATTASGTFSFCYALTSIEEIVSHENLVWDAPFAYCTFLENVTFSGVIAQNGLSFQHSTLLSRASIENIVGCLSTTTSGLSVTFSKMAVNKVFTDTEWATLANTRSNWTINLV